jgi:hypothetical protein
MRSPRGKCRLLQDGAPPALRGRSQIWYKAVVSLVSLTSA